MTLLQKAYKIFIISNYTGAVHTNQGWWYDVIAYQIFTTSFNNKQLPNANQLQYLSNIGVNALWLTPIFESPSEDGYDTTDYYSVKSSFGGNSAFDIFAARAGESDVRVILDLVLNHASSQHSWFVDSRNKVNNRRDWFVWSNALPTGWGRAWGNAPDPTSVWHSFGGNWYYGAFWHGMPDLNHNNDAVKAELTNIIHFWLNKDVDGYRLDAIRYLIETGPLGGQRDTPETQMVLKEYQTAVKAAGANKMTVGEAWDRYPRRNFRLLSSRRRCRPVF